MNQPCGVCNSSAGISHFGAIACRSCGAFFRRVVVLGRHYECECGDLKQNPLAMGMHVRKCKGCRMEKCLSIGMQENLVRAVRIHNFHRERTKEINEKHSPNQNENSSSNSPSSSGEFSQVQFPQLSLEGEYSAQLKEMEKRIEHMQSPNGNIWKILEETEINNTNGLLARWEKFSLSNFTRSQTNSPTDPEDHLQMPNHNEIWARQGIAWDLRLLIDLIKKLPIFGQLELIDQLSLVNNFTVVTAMLLMSFYAAEQNIQNRSSNDEFLQKSVQRVEQLALLAPNRDELLLLIILLFLNTSTTSISAHAQQLLSLEMERFGQILLGIQRQRHGPQGELCFQQLLQLLQLAIGDMQKFSEICAVVGKCGVQKIQKYPQTSKYERNSLNLS